ncbi:flavodoxin family protein [Demequina zhanjiangensis]|uniref:Flavodoxin family protein n=1 Tax=Demequina zhanjiangensis TaxID=3051659 RepID=A0ABT8FZ46_9MICO|nr:flavodoxin family protein [Demequina sp. SYSU T00b26]MDN4472161.1 flavodoxin family protein [Demequina sp. SYSU T00b26]
MTEADFSGLKAVYLNTTLKPSPALSHTQGLMDDSIALMREHGVQVDVIRAADHDIRPGVYPDMREDVPGGNQDADDWPELAERILAADILVLGTPIWLGDKSSVATRVIERLYGLSGELNDRGQYLYYGKTAGVIVTGNEDGVKHVAMNVLYSLQHLGYVIPPNADAGWLGAIGPGPSYLDEGSGGPETEFTQRNLTFMTWNLMHTAAWLRDSGGFPAGGNSRQEWDEGERFGHPNPEYR